jgi:hypothetical protein
MVIRTILHYGDPKIILGDPKRLLIWELLFHVFSNIKLPSLPWWLHSLSNGYELERNDAEDSDMLTEPAREMELSTKGSRANSIEKMYYISWNKMVFQIEWFVSNSRRFQIKETFYGFFFKSRLLPPGIYYNNNCIWRFNWTHKMNDLKNDVFK